MKTRLLRIFTIIIFTLLEIQAYCQDPYSNLWDVKVYEDPEYYYPGLIEGIPSLDQGVETIWLSPTYTSSGGIPYDIIYVDDASYGVHHAFVYTERKLMVYEVDEPEWLATVDISDFGSQTLRKLTQPLLSSSREKHLAYNADKHELYCLTQDLKIQIIDPNVCDLEIKGEILPETALELIDWAILKYDPYSRCKSSAKSAPVKL